MDKNVKKALGIGAAVLVGAGLLGAGIGAGAMLGDNSADVDYFKAKVNILEKKLSMEPKVIHTERVEILKEDVIVEVPVAGEFLMIGDDEVTAEDIASLEAELTELLGGKEELDALLAEKDMTIEDLRDALADEMENPFAGIQKKAFEVVEDNLDELDLDVCGGEHFSDNEIDIDWSEKFFEMDNIDIKDNEYCSVVKADFEYEDDDLECDRNDVEVEVCKDDDGDYEVELV